MAFFIPIIAGSTRRDRQSIKVAVLCWPGCASGQGWKPSCFKEDGTPNELVYEKRAAAFLDEVFWSTEAIADRKTEKT